VMDDGLRELIDREADGDLDETESAKLREALDRDPGARAYRDEVTRLVRLLGAIPSEPPPRDLKHEIMSEIHQEHRRVVKRAPWYEPILRALAPPRLRTGFAFAGGAALGLFAAWLALGGDILSSGTEYSVVGTMGVDVRNLTGVDRWELPLSGGRVMVETKQGSGVGVVEVSVRADSRVIVTLDLDPARVSPLGYVGKGVAPDRVEIEGSRVTFTQYGEAKAILFLEPHSAAGSVIAISVDEAGRRTDGEVKATGLGG